MTIQHAADFGPTVARAIADAPNHPNGRVMTLDEAIAWANGWDPITGKWDRKRATPDAATAAVVVDLVRRFA